MISSKNSFPIPLVVLHRVDGWPDPADFKREARRRFIQYLLSKRS